MLEEPISEKELRDTIIKSLKRRVKWVYVVKY
jgi:hypothetical protein